MLQINVNDALQAEISGEFWEFDRLYFAITHLTGAHGIEQECPFPGYEAVCENLLGLNYELRHAMQGDREIRQFYNGISKFWFAPEGQEDRIRESEKESDSADAFNIDAFEDSLLMNLPEDMDTDDFMDLDREEQIDLLLDIGYDEEEINEYFFAVDHEKIYHFAEKEYPEISENNTYLAVTLPYSEVLFYALILHELLSKKELFIEKCKKDLQKDPTGLSSLYFYSHMNIDLDYLQLFLHRSFQGLYSLLRKDEYVRWSNCFEDSHASFLHADMEACNQLVIKYHTCEEEKAKETIQAFLKEITAEIVQQ